MARHLLHPGETLRVRSKMVDGMIFIDGPAECDDVTLGDVLEFRKSDEKLTLLGMDRSRNVEA